MWTLCCHKDVLYFLWCSWRRPGTVYSNHLQLRVAFLLWTVALTCFPRRSRTLSFSLVWVEGVSEGRMARWGLDWKVKNVRGRWNKEQGQKSARIYITYRWLFPVLPFTLSSSVLGSVYALLLTSASFLLCLVLISSACFLFGVLYFFAEHLKPHVLTFVSFFFLKDYLSLVVIFWMVPHNRLISVPAGLIIGQNTQLLDILPEKWETDQRLTRSSFSSSGTQIVKLSFTHIKSLRVGLWL